LTGMAGSQPHCASRTCTYRAVRCVV
jgi:hypothetical protein